MGLSRNKVAVPEGAAGSPPFYGDHVSVDTYRMSVDLILQWSRHSFLSFLFFSLKEENKAIRFYFSSRFHRFNLFKHDSTLSGPPTIIPVGR